MNEIRFKEHPVSIIQGIGKNLLLLLFPTARALLALHFDVYTWISGAWLDILTIIAVFSYAYFKYRYKNMLLKDGELVFSRGVILKRSSVIPTDKIATVYFSTNPLYRLLGAVRVIIETNGGSSKSPELLIILSKKQANIFESGFAAEKCSMAKKTYKPKLHFLIFYSIQSTSTLSGILLVSAFFSQGGAILGRGLREEFLNTIGDLSKRIFLGIPPVATAISIILLICWAVGFFFNVIRYLNFRIMKKDNMLIIDKGIFVRQKYYADSKKIISVARKQSLLTKLLGISSVFLNCAGYGKGKGESSVVFPAITNSESDYTLNMILPEFHFTRIKTRPKSTALFSYISIPLLLCLANTLLLILVAESNSELTELIKFALFISLIPCVWFVIFRAVASRLCGVGIDGGYVTISYVKGFSFWKVCCRKDSIIKAKIKENPVNRITKKCRLEIICAGEYAHRHVILGLSRTQATKIVKKFL